MNQEMKRIMEALMVEEMQRMAKRIEELVAMLERQTARIVDLQTHIENFEGEDRVPVYTNPPKQNPHNFCPRCGKRRGGDVNYIHTCTPPRGLEKNT